MAKNRAPRVRRVSRTVMANESLAAKSFVRASDPDKDTITKYRIRHHFDGKGRHGYLMLDGVKIREGKWITVTADQLKQLRFMSAKVGQNRRKAGDQIDVRAYDGRAWSKKTTSEIHTLHNNARPIVRPAHQQIIALTTLDVAGLFNVFDRNGNSIKKYVFRDFTPDADSAYLTLNGNIKMKTNQKWFKVSANQLSNLVLVAGNEALTDKIQVRAFDGKHWSRIRTLLVNTLKRPTLVTEPTTVVNELESTPMPTLVQDNSSVPPITTYQFIDFNGDTLSGQIRQGFTPYSANTVHTVSAGTMAGLRFVGGRYQDRQRDTVAVRAFNGFFWTAWESFDVITEPHHIAALDTGENWTLYINNPSANGPLTITYSFMQRPGPEYQDAPEEDGFSRVIPEVAFMVREVFAELEEWLNIRFVEVSDLTGGTIRIGMHDQGQYPPGHAYGPRALTDPIGGDIWFNNLVDPDIPVNWIGTYSNTEDGALPFQMVRHYIGISLGLRLPHQGFPLLPGATDNNQYTVMAFNTQPDIMRPKAGQNFRYAQSYQLYDMAALGEMYGYRPVIHGGNTTYTFTNGIHHVETLIDSSGVDTIDVSNQTYVGGATIDLRQGAFSSFGSEFGFDAIDNLAIAHGTEIENVIGTDRNDRITGNELNNSILGGDGNDIIRGMSGDDTLNGQDGNDRYWFDLFGGNDLIDEAGHNSIDTLEIRSFSNDIQSFEENLSFRKQGNTLYVNLVLATNQGVDLVDGSIAIRNMTVSGREGVERLRLTDMAGNSLFAFDSIDLVSVYENATRFDQHMTVLGTDGTYGKLVATA